MAQKDLKILVQLGESSPLRTALNHAVVSLSASSQTVIRPHVCLNGIEGIEVLRKISADPEVANTRFDIGLFPIIAGKDIWLNTQLFVFLNNLRMPVDLVALSPRQSSFVVRSLPEEFQITIIEKLKTWFFEEVYPNIKEGMETISAQFSGGDPLIESDHQNRVFDTHGGRRLDVPYTESRIAGLNLFHAVVRSKIFYERQVDGYQEADYLIEAVRLGQKKSIEDFLKSMFGLRNLLEE